ncbi:hypothetical protein [Methanospirillum lacunae]|uniref:Uncharacterized protein n=1 Tax=Methanospirillum lacunae TaxID=668570 RepID=A0A2V2N7E7_9EURY|nr:hypothetical protein [Methanospirillum lacunae]PWR72147.1 hypothetical protein DK846_09155 [Methanospirillum lacunae]
MIVSDNSPSGTAKQFVHGCWQHRPMKPSSFCCLIFLVLSSGILDTADADRLPSTVPEIQEMTIESQIEANGPLDDSTKMDWITVKNGSTTDTTIGKGELISSAVYRESLLSNGGLFDGVKNTGFDSSDQRDSSFNLESEKVMTYSGTDGSHLVGNDYLLLDVNGNYTSNSTDSVMCVFSDEDYLIPNPAFSDYVEAQGSLINFNSGEVSTKSQVRAVGSRISTSAGLSYQIEVSPDISLGEESAEGIVKTRFAGIINEARDKKTTTSSKSKSKNPYANDWNKTAATNTWKDETDVAGDISLLQKSFGYKSGLKL